MSTHRGREIVPLPLRGSGDTEASGGHGIWRSMAASAVRDGPRHKRTASRRGFIRTVTARSWAAHTPGPTGSGEPATLHGRGAPGTRVHPVPPLKRDVCILEPSPGKERGIVSQ